MISKSLYLALRVCVCMFLFSSLINYYKEGFFFCTRSLFSRAWACTHQDNAQLLLLPLFLLLMFLFDSFYQFIWFLSFMCQMYTHISFNCTTDEINEWIAENEKKMHKILKLDRDRYELLNYMWSDFASTSSKMNRKFNLFIFSFFFNEWNECCCCRFITSSMRAHLNQNLL